MFWGSISSKYGRHRGLFVEKDWETINKGSYSGIIVPAVQEILEQYPELSFQQDNAKGHLSAFTISVLNSIGIKPTKWPANSPDLDLIETIWDLMKDYIQAKYSDVHRSYKRLREAVQEAWESITRETIQELIRGMGDRYIEVILADGGHTRRWSQASI
jgi:hypothetical protein